MTDRREIAEIIFRKTNAIPTHTVWEIADEIVKPAQQPAEGELISDKTLIRDIKDILHKRNTPHFTWDDEDAREIIAMILQRMKDKGWKSPEEVKFIEGYKIWLNSSGYVKMADDQTLPTYDSYTWDEINAHSKLTTWDICQAVMIQAGWRKVELAP